MARTVCSRSPSSVIVPTMQPRMGGVWLFFVQYKTPSAFAGTPAGVRSIVRVDPVVSACGLNHRLQAVMPPASEVGCSPIE
jgi:hypothetical protein